MVDKLSLLVDLHLQVSMAMKMATLEKAEELLEDLRSTSWEPALKGDFYCS